MVHYEHRLTQTLWLRLHSKGGLVKLICLVGKEKGNIWRITKERRKREFKKLKKEEIGKFFKEKQHTKIELPDSKIIQKAT